MLAALAAGCNKSNNTADASGSAPSAVTSGAASTGSPMAMAAPAPAGRAPKTGTDENPLVPGGPCPGRVKVTADADAKAAGVTERTIEPSTWGISGCNQRHVSSRYRSSPDASTYDTFYMQASVELGETPTTQQLSLFTDNPNVLLSLDFPGGAPFAPAKWDDQLARHTAGDPAARISYVLPLPDGAKKIYKIWACETKIDARQELQRAASGKFSIEVTSVQGKAPTPEELETPPIKQGIHGTARAECPPAKLRGPNTAAGTVTLEITF